MVCNRSICSTTWRKQWKTEYGLWKVIVEANFNCSLEKKNTNTVSFELKVISFISALIFRLFVVAFFNNKIAVISLATENVMPNREKWNKTKTMERQFVHVITGELNFSRVKETCEWDRIDLLKFKIVKMKTYRLVGGKHQMWNNKSSKATEKDDETHCFSFFLAVVSKFDWKREKKALHVTYTASARKRRSKEGLNSCNF